MKFDGSKLNNQHCCPQWGSITANVKYYSDHGVALGYSNAARTAPQAQARGQEG